jgi:hypothetical protein
VEIISKITSTGSFYLLPNILLTLVYNQNLVLVSGTKKVEFQFWFWYSFLLKPKLSSISFSFVNFHPQKIVFIYILFVLQSFEGCSKKIVVG